MMPGDDDKVLPQAAKTKAPKTKDTDVPEESPRAIQEVGGPEGPEPTRYGDWERNGRCYDF